MQRIIIPTRPFVRWVITRDLPRLAEIERSAGAEPWDETAIAAAIRPFNRIGMVAEIDGGYVVGHMIHELRQGSIHLERLVVDPACRRQRVGMTLVDKLLRKLSPQGRATLTMQVGEYNLPGQLFLRACGFRAVRVLRGRDDSAYLFEHRVGDEVCEGR